MDEQTKEYAARFMASNAGSIGSYERFPVKLADEQSMCAMLLGWYGCVVKSRGGEFLMDDTTTSKVEKVVKWMLESKKRGLLLCGTLGNGKTTMLRALKYLFSTRAVFMEAQAVYDSFKKSPSLPFVSPKDLLLIDDLGVEPPSFNDYGQIRYPLTEFLMSRYKSNSTTIIATNCTFEQLGRIYGDRIHDRMREMFAMITYTEPSYRK